MKTTWATEVDAKGRPIELPNQRPTREGDEHVSRISPAAAASRRTSFDPALGLFFISARETCQTYSVRSAARRLQAGRSVMGGGTRNRGGTGALRAIDPVTLEHKWEVPYGGPSYSGVLSTASGLVFAGDHDGTLMGVDSRTGALSWRYSFGAPLYGAPSTFMIDGRQILLMPAGATLTAFALPSN